MPKCVALDFDGTIADSRPFLASFYNRMLSRKFGGKTLEMDDLEILRGLSLRAKMRYLKISTLKLPLFVKAARKALGENITHFPCFAGVKELLQRLRDRGYTLAIISSNRVRTIRRFLKAKEIELFDHIYCDRGTSLFVKANTIRRFLRKTGLSATDVVYVGDELRDIEASRKGGVRIVAVTWGHESARVLRSAEPDFLANTPEDVERAVVEVLGEHRFSA